MVASLSPKYNPALRMREYGELVNTRHQSKASVLFFIDRFGHNWKLINYILIIKKKLILDEQIFIQNLSKNVPSQFPLWFIT